MGKKKVHNFATLLRARGRLAQLVQSVCLTSRGSGVRIPQRPQHQPRLNANRVSALERAAQKAEAADAAASQTLLRGTLRNRALKQLALTKAPFRALSSAGSERLPYKQRVGGSNPSAPTTEINAAGIPQTGCLLFLSCLCCEEAVTANASRTAAIRQDDKTKGDRHLAASLLFNYTKLSWACSLTAVNIFRRGEGFGKGS